MSEITDKPKRKSVAFSEDTTVVDSDGQVTEVANSNGGDRTTAESHAHDANGGDAAVDEVADLLKDLGKKKKKKPKKEDEGEADEKVADDGDDIDLGALKKKKKKKSSKTADVDDFEKRLAEAGEGGEEKPETDEIVDEGDPLKGTGIWQHESTQAIPYKLLLSRFFTLLSDRHPDLVGGSGKSYKIPPPQCLREGNKKTLLANLPEICKRLKRSDEHVTSFLFAELGTSGSVDGSRRLVIKGRFQSKQIENVLRRYIVDYVVCKTCKSPDTELSKGENRLYFVTCNSCGSRRSVQAIKSGFSAQIGKRKRMQT
jgi:translation initiation factor 2 subunit 2